MHLAIRAPERSLSIIEASGVGAANSWQDAIEGLRLAGNHPILSVAIFLGARVPNSERNKNQADGPYDSSLAHAGF